MLHEVLLGLSGLRSPLLEAHAETASVDNSLDTSLRLSASEKHLLRGIGTLSRTHRLLIEHTQTIAHTHPSIICRAVANSIRQTHLKRFRAKVLEVEASVLRKDASTVGAYDIVPLAYVVGQFDEWQRRMAWYWDLASFMLVPDTNNGCSGATLINRLRTDAQTGFPDIEEVARELSAVAELAWLKQLAVWLLYGKVNALGKADFFIQEDTDETGSKMFRRRRDLLPKFVSSSIASSMLFIGRSLNHIQDNQKSSATSSKGKDLIGAHMQILTDMSLPIQAAQLNDAIAKIRSSVSQNMLQDLLPIQTTRIALTCLRRYLLLANSDFASCLLAEAENQVAARWQKMDALSQRDPVKALQGLSLKDTEATQVLRKTWKNMAISQSQDHNDEVLDFAEKHIALTIPKKAASRPSTADSAIEERATVSPVVFNDLLLATPTTLAFQVRAPLDLIFSALDMGIYSAMNAYLLAIRRAQQRLESLWRRNTVRRHTPSKAGSLYVIVLRQAWATSSAALLLLSELAAYLSSTVVIPSCDHFESWAVQQTTAEEDDKTRRDPESLAAGHRVFLDVLTHGVLLTDIASTKELRSFLVGIDQITSLFGRVLDMPVDARKGLEEDNIKAYVDLQKACRRVQHDRRGVFERLKDLHARRIDPIEMVMNSSRDTGGYVPLRVGGLDQLLMKLEYEQIVIHEDET